MLLDHWTLLQLFLEVDLSSFLVSVDCSSVEWVADIKGFIGNESHRRLSHLTSLIMLRKVIRSRMTMCSRLFSFGVFKKGNKYSIFLCMIFLRVTFIFYVYPVPLVLLLPNVGTHLPEATSPSLVVRQTVWCNIWSNANDDLIMFKPYRVHFVLFIKSFSFCFIFSAEPVRPIDPAAWISHTTALTAPYPHYGKGYLLLCSSIKGHFSVTEL